MRLHTSMHFRMIFANSGYAIFQMRKNATDKVIPPRAHAIEDPAVWKPMLNRCQRDEPEACGPLIADLATMWYTRHKNPAISEFLFRWAEQAQPASGQTQYIIAHYYDYDLNKPQDAERYYKRAYELSPNNPLIVREYLLYQDLVKKDNRTVYNIMRTRKFREGNQLSILDLRDAALACEASVSALQLMRDRDYADDLWDMARAEGAGNQCVKNNWPIFSPNFKPMAEDLTRWGLFKNVFWQQAMRSHLSSATGGAGVRFQRDRRPWKLDVSPMFAATK